MYREAKCTPLFGITILLSMLLLAFLPWAILPRELFRQESLMAVEATEINSLIVTAHHQIIRNAPPLFPAFASLFVKYVPIPLEYAMRLLSMFFVFCGGILVYFGSATGNGRRAGFVASSIYISTMLVMEKAVDGLPGSLNAFLLLSAQMSFFYFGFRQGKWNKAWIITGILLILGYFSGGLPLLLLFIVPLGFFRRPLSGGGKYRHWGFLVSAIVVFATVLAYQLCFRGIAAQESFIDSFSWSKYLKELLQFWLYLPFRLLPWTIIAWLPFCAALQAIDPKPLFSKYLRTIFFITVLLLWLSPKQNSQALLYLPGTLAILCGVTYELGIRRYGEKIRTLTNLSIYFGIATIAIMFFGAYADKSQFPNFISFTQTLNFRESKEFMNAFYYGVIGILMISIILYWSKKKAPVWVVLLGISAMVAIFNNTFLLRYRTQSKEKRTLGHEIRKILTCECKSSSNLPTLYKSNITDLYGALYYSKLKVVQSNSDKDFPESEKTIYLISPEFPDFPKHHWSLLDSTTYLGNSISLWKGVKR